jgi:hypothetical protein
MTADRIAATAACVLVAAGVIAGFSLTGSPQKMRTQALDRRRTADMRAFADAVQARYTNDEAVPPRLPRTLTVIRTDGSDATRDPVTGRPYRYTRESATRFRLCATFALADDRRDRYEFAPHPAGPVCYRFDVRGGYETNPIGDGIRERSSQAPKHAP